MSQRYEMRPVSERGLWDTFVANHTWGHLLQSWGWGELKASAGWHPLRLALWDNERGEMVAAAQVLRRAAPYLPPRLGHLAYIPRGPVLDWSAGEERAPLYETFFTQLLSYLRGQGAIALQIELPLTSDHPACCALESHMAARGFRSAPAVQPRRTIILDLTPDEESLLGRMKEKWRYNTRLAARKGVQVRDAQTREDVQAWYRLLQITGERDSFGIHTFDYYWRAWQIFAPRGQGQLLLAEHEGQLLAGIFVCWMAKQALYLYGASSNEQRNLMPNYLLQWEAIRRAKHVGAQSYDFWGIPETDDEDEAMRGVYRFKSGWGGSITRFAGNYEYDYHPRVMRFARRLM